MKKMLVLAVILSVATMSFAMNLSLRANGTDVSTIAINPGDTLNLSINADGFAQGDGMTWGVVIYTAGSITGGAVTAAAPDNCYVAPAGENQAWLDMFPGVMSGAFGGIDTWSTSPTYTNPAGIYVDGIAYVGGDTVIQLGTITFGETSNTFTPVDSLIVTPEPVTMALLGLGGLFLRRRK
jgi:hypothetical protein